MADELFALKTNFYIGAHQAVISEALTVSPSTDAVRVERDFFMYRAYVEQGQHRVVLDEVGADAPASLQAVKLLATYLSSPRDAKETCLLQLKEWLADAGSANNWHLLVVARITRHARRLCLREGWAAAGPHRDRLKGLVVYAPSACVHVIIAAGQTGQLLCALHIILGTDGAALEIEADD